MENNDSPANEGIYELTTNFAETVHELSQKVLNSGQDSTEIFMKNAADLAKVRLAQALVNAPAPTKLRDLETWNKVWRSLEGLDKKETPGNPAFGFPMVRPMPRKNPARIIDAEPGLGESGEKVEDFEV